MPLDSGGGFVGIDANISIKQLPGISEQSTQLFLVNPLDLRMMCDRPRELNTCIVVSPIAVVVWEPATHGGQRYTIRQGARDDPLDLR